MPLKHGSKLGYLTEALYHAMKLTDMATLLTILQEHAWRLFHQGELKLLEESLNRIDYPNLIQKPDLVLLKAWLVQSQHRHTESGNL